MRLICPNCSAQYEIDASLIPDEGRDVQCSNCGHTWFELAPDAEADAPIRLEESDTAETVAPQKEAEVVEAEPPTAAQDASPDEADDEEPSRAARAIAAATRDLDEEELDEEEVFGAPVRPNRPAVDRAALEVLKEEASRELAKRRAAPSVPLETQTDLGIDALKGDTPSRALRARMARVTGEEKQSGLSPAPEAESVRPMQEEYQAPRKDLLPDIDEINSSLRPGSDREEADEATRRRGFRLGFGLMLVAAALMILAYAYAPTLAAALPATEPALLGYVDWANNVRDWLDTLLGQPT